MAVRPTKINGVALYKQPWYGSYHSMMDRCYRKTAKNYKFYHGESHTLAEWARILGVKKSLIQNRVWYGWSPERVIEQEVERHERKAR